MIDLLILLICLSALFVFGIWIGVQRASSRWEMSVPPLRETYTSMSDREFGYALGFNAAVAHIVGNTPKRVWVNTDNDPDHGYDVHGPGGYWRKQ